MSRATAQTLLPLLAVAALAVYLVATGDAAQDFAQSQIGTWIFGFFFNNFAPFLFAIAYGVAHVLAVAVFGDVRSRILALLLAPFAAALLLIACTYPTFGGFVLRPGFMAGGVSLLQHLDPLVGSLAGAVIAGLAFALVLGIVTTLVRLKLSVGFTSALRGIGRGLWLVLPALVLVLAPRFGLTLGGTWPKTALGVTDGLVLGAVALLAFLPHAALSANREA
jgi:hypothetical protein